MTDPAKGGHLKGLLKIISTQKCETDNTFQVTNHSLITQSQEPGVSPQIF